MCVKYQIQTLLFCWKSWEPSEKEDEADIEHSQNPVLPCQAKPPNKADWRENK